MTGRGGDRGTTTANSPVGGVFDIQRPRGRGRGMTNDQIPKCPTKAEGEEQGARSEKRGQRRETRDRRRQAWDDGPRTTGPHRSESGTADGTDGRGADIGGQMSRSRKGWQDH